MHTKEWAPMAWAWLHAAALVKGASPEREQAFAEVIVLLQHTLPCQLCRTNMRGELQQLNDSTGLVRDFEHQVARQRRFDMDRLECILHCLHNSVNKRLGKPVFDRRDLRAVHGRQTIGALDVKLMQFLNAVVYVATVDGLSRGRQVILLLDALLRAFPEPWRTHSKLAGALAWAMASPGRADAARVWELTLIRLQRDPMPGPVRDLAHNLLGVWRRLLV